MDTTTLYAHNGQDWYRIPALIATAAGTVLAFASRRKGSEHDFGHDTDVVLRRSTDGGRSFGDMQTLASAPGIDIHHGPSVEDRQRGRLLKFCRYWPASGDPQKTVQQTPWPEMQARGYVDYRITSDDDGASWSEPQPVIMPYPATATSCGTGNGVHGIQLRDGRLLIQGGYVLDGQRYCCVLTSDDGGETWAMGAETAASIVREFTMAELADGTIYYNLRHNTADRRTVSWSADRGASFGELRQDPTLVEPICHAGLVSHGQTLLFSNPNHANTTGRYSAGTRRDMTVRASLDGGQTWPHCRPLNDQFAGYSDLAVLPDDTVLCIYECGPQAYHDQIDLARFPLA